MNATASVLYRIGLGTANLGFPYGLLKRKELCAPETTEAASFEILSEATSLGIPIFDTAHQYGLSESLIGKFLSQNPSPKAEVISKFSEQKVEENAEISVRRLGNHLTTLLWHNFDPTKITKDSTKKLEGLQRKYPHLNIGCSTYGPQSALAAVESGLFRTIEIEYNVLNPHVLSSIRIAARKKNIRLILRSILQKGFLTSQLIDKKPTLHPNKNINRTLLAIGDQLYSFAVANHMSVEELALRYAAMKTESEVILIGANSKEQLRFNVEQLNKGPLDPQILSELERIAGLVEPDFLDLRHWVS